MTHFSVPIRNNGPVASAYIGVSSEFRKMLIKEGKPVPSLVPIRLLIDTGATTTTICASKVSLLGLHPTGSVPVHTPSTGANPVSQLVYDLSIIIPGAGDVLSDAYVLPEHEILESDFSAQPGMDGLLGRDILKSCHMTYAGIEELCILSFGSGLSAALPENML